MLDAAVPARRPARHAARRPPAHARLPRPRAIACLGVAALRPVGRPRRALRAPPDRRRVGRRRGARPARAESGLPAADARARPCRAARGSTGTTSRPRGPGEQRVGRANAESCSRCLIVGKTSSSSPRAWASRAAAAANQPRSTISSPSGAAPGRRAPAARKKCVSKRIGTCARRDPARERDERRRVGQHEPGLLADLAHGGARCAASPSPSPASTAPPGNTHAPPMKRARRVAPHEQDLERVARRRAARSRSPPGAAPSARPG